MPLTCLIAAHDPWVIQLLRIYSEESGFRVVQAYEGQDVLPMIHQEHPAAVFLQADLPGKIKGWEVLNLIKTTQSTTNIPVLIFSYMVPLHEEEMGSLEGAEAQLQEPVTFEVFQDALKKVGVNHSGEEALQPFSSGNPPVTPSD